MMINPPLLSIVTITKNDPQGFIATSESIAAQSFKDYERVIIDGNIEPDDGIYDAMNKGLDRSSGQYVLFLNSGDTLADPDILSLVARHIEAHKSDFIYGDSMENIAGKLMIKKARPHHTYRLGMFTSHQAMLYRREIIGQMRFDCSYKIAGDYDFTVRFLSRDISTSYIPAPISFFEGNGLSERHANLGMREEWMVRTKILTMPTLTKLVIIARQRIASFIRGMNPKAFLFVRNQISGHHKG